MKLFSKFSFWLPFLSLMLILFELFFRPAKSFVWIAFDPLFALVRSLMPEAANAFFFLMLLHFLLALFYGIAIDVLIKKINDSSDVH